MTTQTTTEEKGRKMKQREETKSSYQAVMEVMCGNELTDFVERGHDWACEGAADALKAMRLLEDMSVGDTCYITVGTMVGYVSHGTREEAIAWAQETHPSQEPHVFKVERLNNWWRLTNLLF